MLWLGFKLFSSLTRKRNISISKLSARRGKIGEVHIYNHASSEQKKKVTVIDLSPDFSAQAVQLTLAIDCAPFIFYPIHTQNEIYMDDVAVCRGNGILDDVMWVHVPTRSFETILHKPFRSTFSWRNSVEV